MTTKKDRKYTQKTIQTTSAPHASTTANASLADPIQAADEQVDDSPLTVHTLQDLLKTLREDISADMKVQMEAMKNELQGEMALLRRECKADIDALRKELSLQLKTLSDTQEETTKTQTELEKALNDNSDRMTALERSYETLTKQHQNFLKSAWTSRTEVEDKIYE
ncbi:hypothetical protein WMY93_021279 [Mugilogobius chulae]|uniref:Coiled-coil domain-containing protein 153 n=1 Tax=Mugilogobius chulae TaxID=88201 RepID=A0AAW0NKA4_9GOBI